MFKKKKPIQEQPLSQFTVAKKDSTLKANILDAANPMISDIPLTDTVQNNDLFLLQRGSENYSIEAESLTPKIYSTINVTVGTSGDYPTINAALNYLTRFTPAYINKVSTGAVISLLSGFVITEQINATNVDLSWIEIDGGSQSFNVDASSFTTVSFIGGIDAKLPTLKNIKFVFIAASPSTTFYCLNLDNSCIKMIGDVDLGQIGGVNSVSIYMKNASILNGESLTAISNNDYAIKMYDSQCNLSGDLNLSTSNKGIYILAGKLSATNISCNNCLGGGIEAHNGGNVIASQSLTTTNYGIGTFGLRVESGALISANQMDCKQSGVESGTDIIIGEQISAGIVISGLLSTNAGGSNITPNTITPHGIFFKS